LLRISFTSPLRRQIGLVWRCGGFARRPLLCRIDVTLNVRGGLPVAAFDESKP